jgi:hypothetical protein
VPVAHLPPPSDERENMELNLTGKRALVTGSSIGLGEATAKMLVVCLANS